MNARQRRNVRRHFERRVGEWCFGRAQGAKLVISNAELVALPVYDLSIPTGPEPGFRWKVRPAHALRHNGLRAALKRGKPFPPYWLRHMAWVATVLDEPRGNGHAIEYRLACVR